jgi:hypothetical protein
MPTANAHGGGLPRGILVVVLFVLQEFCGSVLHKVLIGTLVQAPVKKHSGRIRYVARTGEIPDNRCNAGLVMYCWPVRAG